MELGAVQQTTEDVLDLLADDAGAVVRDRDDVATRLGRMGRSRDLFDLDLDLREDARFFARIQRIVHGFLHRRQKRLARIVKPQQVPVLREELGDGNIALFGRHRLSVGFGSFRTFGHSTLLGGAIVQIEIQI